MLGGRERCSQFPPPKNAAMATNAFNAAQVGEAAPTAVKMDTPKMETCHTSRRPARSASSPNAIAPRPNPAYCTAESRVAYFGANSLDACGITRAIEHSSICEDVRCFKLCCCDAIYSYLVNDKAKTARDHQLPLVAAHADSFNCVLDEGRVWSWKICGSRVTYFTL